MRIGRLGAGIVVALLLLAGCGGDDDDQAATDEQTDQTDTTDDTGQTDETDDTADTTDDTGQTDETDDTADTADTTDPFSPDGPAELPEGWPSDLPEPADSELTFVVGEDNSGSYAATYSSDASSVDLAEGYREDLAAGGFDVTEDVTATAEDSIAIFTADDGEWTVTVTVSPFDELGGRRSSMVVGVEQSTGAST